jgi:cytochrome c peroxidase
MSDEESPMNLNRMFRCVSAALLSGAALLPAAQATTPSEQLAAFSALAGSPPSTERGRTLFTTRQGREWSCSSCHGAEPRQDGKHASTGKVIAPLAPAVNAQRFTDVAKTEKWFRRNCNDVIGRECSPAEKVDVLSWLLTIKP